MPNPISSSSRANMSYDPGMSVAPPASSNGEDLQCRQAPSGTEARRAPTPQNAPTARSAGTQALLDSYQPPNRCDTAIGKAALSCVSTAAGAVKAFPRSPAAAAELVANAALLSAAATECVNNVRNAVQVCSDD